MKESNCGGNDVPINEAAVAKCRVNALQRVREKERKPRRHVGAASASRSLPTIG